MQTKTTTCLGKNIGRSNETTPAEQAELEALAKHTLKAKSGYSPSLDAPSTVQLPQKVSPYVGNEHKIVFPAYSTPKLNGVNGTYWLLPDGSLKLTSRGGLEYPPIPHLEDGVRYLMSMFSTDCLNGELYIHGEHLQDITSAVKKPKPLSNRLTFNVFEFPTLDLPMHNKFIWLSVLSNTTLNGDEDPYTDTYRRNSYVRTVKPVRVTSYEDIEAHYNLCMSQGFEGTVIYNPTSVYKFNERSSSVFKYKKSMDAEYLVTGYTLDKNGHVVYRCSVVDGDYLLFFNVKRKGTNAERLADALIAESNIGKWLTVHYEVLSKGGTPLKPVGLSFRSCNDLGEPNE
jgi:DNA ligase-1